MTASASSAFAVIRDLISPVADEYRCAENEMLKTFEIWVGTSDRTLLSFELVSDVHISTRLAKLSYSVPDPEFLTGRHRQRNRNGIKHNLRRISIKTAELVKKKKRIQIYCTPCWKKRDVILISNKGIQLVQMPMTTRL